MSIMCLQLKNQINLLMKLIVKILFLSLLLFFSCKCSDQKPRVVFKSNDRKEVYDAIVQLYNESFTKNELIIIPSTYAGDLLNPSIIKFKIMDEKIQIIHLIFQEKQDYKFFTSERGIKSFEIIHPISQSVKILKLFSI
jgi:hypothetical protein